jgi:hypothetical protein
MILKLKTKLSQSSRFPISQADPNGGPLLKSHVGRIMPAAVVHD